MNGPPVFRNGLGVGDVRLASCRVAPPTPATRDQVDAYRFGLRRLEAALVRGDPVPVHEQVRAQRRAVAAGVVLGVLGLVVALVVAVVVPRPAVAAAGPAGRPAVGRALRRRARTGPAGARRERRLRAARARRPAVGCRCSRPGTRRRRGPRRGAADPGGRRRGRGGRGPAGADRAAWAVCDEVTPTGSAGRHDRARRSGARRRQVDGVLIAVPGGDTWLVTGGHRHRVDLDDGPSRTALGLTGRVPRPGVARSGLGVARGAAAGDADRARGRAHRARSARARASATCS